MKKRVLLTLATTGAGLLGMHLLFAKTTRKKASINTFKSVDAYVEGQMQRLRIPGAALAIVEGNQMVHYRGFGQGRPGGEAPSAQTPFFIGSLTKSITALSVMQLVEAGKVELDAPVQRYLPWFRVSDPQASAQMTVRHLLNQTSGFSFLVSNVILADLDDRPGATERQMRALSSLKLSHPVGEKVEYCNLNYNVLGLIIEAASGAPYAEYVQEHIFDPLEMSHTYTSKVAAQQDGLAMGHRHWFGYPVATPNLPVPLGSLPSGQLISCAEDMAHYLLAHLNGGRYGKEQVLSAAGMDELHRGEKEYITFGILAGSYAMGWFDKTIGKTRILTHGGNVPEFSVFMSLVPEQKMGLVLLLNADPYGLPMITDEIGTNLTAVLIGQQPEPIKLDFIQWIFRLLPLVPLLQLVDVISTLGKIPQERHEPVNHPMVRRFWGKHILLSLFPNLSLGAILLLLQSNGLIRFMNLFMPDLAWVVRISGGFGLIWSILRTVLILQYR